MFKVKILVMNNKVKLITGLVLSSTLLGICNNYAFAEEPNKKLDTKKVKPKEPVAKDENTSAEPNPYNEIYPTPEPIDIKIPKPSNKPKKEEPEEKKEEVEPTEQLEPQIKTKENEVEPEKPKETKPKVEPKKELPKKKPLKVFFNPNYILQPGRVLTTTYTVKPNDNLIVLAKRFNLRYRELLRLNDTTSPYLTVGKKITLYKSIQPSSNFNGIIVNIPERKLYYFDSGKLLMSHIISVGNPSAQWQTPIGDYKVKEKVKNPVWSVPPSIQKEMKQKGLEVITQVPAGPNNPLGNWFLALGGGIGIHSTNAPSTVGYFVSHGCIRLRPKSAEQVFNAVKKDTPVKIIYQPVKLNVDDKDNIFLEVYSDIYYKKVNIPNMVEKIIKDYHFENNVDWKKVSKAVKIKSEESFDISKDYQELHSKEDNGIKKNNKGVKDESLVKSNQI